MKKFKTLATLTLAASLTLALTACGAGSRNASVTNNTKTAGAEQGDFGGPLLIGNPQPLSGVNAQVGQTTTNAATLAVEYINENGGFNGQMLELINYDDQNTPEVAVQVTQRMLHNDKVDLVLGTLLSTNLMATGDMFEEAGVLVMGNGTSPSLLSEGWSTMFRAAPNGGDSMSAIMEMAVENGWKTAGLIHGLDDATRSGAEAFAKAAEEAGVKIVATETYIDGDTDFAGQIASIINAKPDFIFMGTNGPTMPLVTRQIRLMDYEGELIFRESPTADAVNVAGDDLNGVMFVYPYITYDSPEQAAEQGADPIMVDFLQRYFDRFGEMPFHDAAYRAWDAMMALWEASRIAGSNDSAALIEAMEQVNIPALGGQIDFTNGDHEGRPTFRVWEMQDGRPVPVE